MGNNCDFCHFDHDMIAGAKQPSLSIYRTVGVLGFSHATVFTEFTLNGPKMIQREGVLNGNALVMRNITGGWPDWFKLTARLHLLR